MMHITIKLIKTHKMKKSLFLSIFLTHGIANAENTIVPLDMEFGYWEFRTEMLESEMMTKMLESMPESQRAMVSDMMKNKLKFPTVKQCITADDFESFEEKFKESMGGNMNCDIEIQESSSKEFLGKFVCDTHTMQIKTRAINTKRQETEIMSDMAGQGLTKMRSVGEWQSSTCPDGIDD